MDRRKSRFSIISPVEDASSIMTNNSIVEEQTNATSDLWTTANTTIENTQINQLQTKQSKMTESFIVVWLCSNTSDSITDRDNFAMQLRHVISSLQIFTEIDQCIDFVTDKPRENIVMIIDHYSDVTFLLVLKDLAQVHSIYIFEKDSHKHPHQTKDLKIVKGTHSKMQDICNAVKQDAHRLVVDLTPISIISSGSSFSLDQLDQSFMYTQLLKEIIIDIKYDAEKAREEFIQFCRSRSSIDGIQVNDVNEFHQCYEDRSPIWWYTKEWFLYSSLNRALRTQDVELIMKMGFFVQDLHREIEQQHSHTHQTSTILAYRGQALSNNDFKKLRKSKGGLFSFNNFLSTSLDRDVSFMFADSNQQNPELTAVLFRMEIDPTISSTPFVRVENISQFELEAEILFSMHTVFRIGDMNQLDDRLWEVKLTLTADNDEELKCLTDYIRNEIQEIDGWLKMVLLMFRMGKFEKALEILNMLMERKSVEHPELLEIFQTLMGNNIGVAQRSLGNYSSALMNMKKFLKIVQEYRPNDYLSVANLYSNIGLTYQSMGDFSSALVNYEKALENQQQSPASDSVTLARIYNNIALTHQSMGSFSSALAYLEKVLEIQQQYLPSNHPEFAATYSNIGMIHRSLGNYSSAVSYFEKTLQIQQKSLSLDHPDMATTHNNIASIYLSARSFSHTLTHLQKALEIQEKSLPSNHPDLALTLHNIGAAHRSNGDHLAALSYYEKALKIWQKTLPSDHLNLATTYYTIGVTHHSMGNYPTAQSSYEKALEIQQKSLPPHHPDIIRTQQSIALLSTLNQDYLSAMLNMGTAFENQQRLLSANCLSSAADDNKVNEMLKKYSEMCSDFKKVTEMQQKLFPSDGSYFTITDEKINGVEELMETYHTMTLSLEKFVQLLQKSPSTKHPLVTGTQVDRIAEDQMAESMLKMVSHLKKVLGMEQRSSSSTDEGASYNDDETDQIPFLMNEYATAMTHYQDVLKVQQKYYPPNDVSLSTHYNNMGQAYYSMENYANALTLFEKALGHLQTCSPINQQLLAKTHNNIAKALAGLGRYREAADYAGQAFEIACSSLGSKHPETEVYQDHLDQLRRK